MLKKTAIFIFVIAIIIGGTTISALDKFDGPPVISPSTRFDPIVSNLPRRDDEFIVYEYGFEDDWNDWSGVEPWEISDEDAHDGEFSAHCPVEANLFSFISTPPIELPYEEWQTYFQFWVHSDIPDFDPDNDNILDDYFWVDIRVNNGAWESILYDYGRDNNWVNNWVHYVPGTWWRNDLPPWRVRQDLSQFAGETIQLRWVLITDDVMEGNQGTGLWIDDFELIATDQAENDAGVEYLHVGYPVTVGTDNESLIIVKNYGMADQNRILQFYRIDNERATPIVPWRELDSGSSAVYKFHIGGRIPYTGNARLSAYTQIGGGDDKPSNDTSFAEILMYPENIWQLGYDNRRWSEGLDFDVTTGPAVLFTPQDEEINERYDLYAIEAAWSSEEQNEAVSVELTIFRDDDGNPGDELYSAEIEVAPENLHPQLHYISLSEVDDLKNMIGNFWVSFTIGREDHLPQILGLQMEDHFNLWAEDHFYTYGGRNIVASEYDFQIHAILSAAGLENRSLEIRPDLAFGEVGIEAESTKKLIAFGGGTQPVTIESVAIDGDDAFSIDLDGEFPVELSVGEIANLYVTFLPDEEGEFEAELSFECDDESSPVVSLTGFGSMLPSIFIEQDELDFGSVEVEDLVELQLNVLNFGLADLIISDIIVEGRFFNVQFDGEVVIEPDGEEEFFASFRPEATGSFEGELRFITNDFVDNAGVVPLYGIGSGGPEVRSPIPDIDVDEDFERYALADLDTVFAEPEDGEFTYTVESGDENFIVAMGEDNVIWVSSELNWEGETVLTVIADDEAEVNANHGGERRMVRSINTHVPHRDLTTELTVDVTVNSINDLPTPFNLLSPENGVSKIDDDQILFQWEESVDEIEKSNVTYIISLRFNNSTVMIGDIDETSKLLTREEMVFRSDAPIEIRWRVLAFDGIDSLQSEDTFHLSISALDVDEWNPNLLPNQVSLYPAAPNPFNSSLNVSFYLPVIESPSLRIFNLAGKEVTQLISGQLASGKHVLTWQSDSYPAGVYS